MTNGASQISDLDSLRPAYLRALANETTDGVLILDPGLAPIFYNQRYLELWNLEESQMSQENGANRRIFMGNLVKDKEVFLKRADAMIKKPNTHFKNDVALIDGRIFESKSIPILEEGELLGLLITYKDITAQRAIEEQRNYLSQYDRITGLLNRTTAFKTLDLILREAKKENETVGVISFDLTRYKRINDRYGHIFGDKVLARVADNISSVAFPHITARLGGDEFVILARNLNREKLADLAHAVSNRLSLIKKVEGETLNLTASFGLSMFPKDADTALDLITQADMALRYAKHSGPNSIVEFFEALSQEISTQTSLDFELPLALQNNCFRLHYQPLISVESKKIVGSEALIRWQCDDNQLKPPGYFLPHAEESGFIVQLGEWALRSACEQSIIWKNMGLGELPVSVNVSGKQLAQSDFAKTVENVLSDTGLDPHLLELELTETAFVEHLQDASTMLEKIRAMGVRVSIDDFGTGYSSLSYLKHFRVDTLKIDLSFTQGIGKTDHDNALVKTAVNMAHTLGLKAVAEGVEEEHQFDYLAEIGCDYAQGYLFSKPLDPNRFESFLLASKN